MTYSSRRVSPGSLLRENTRFEDCVTQTTAILSFCSVPCFLSSRFECEVSFPHAQAHYFSFSVKKSATHANICILVPERISPRCLVHNKIGCSVIRSHLSTIVGKIVTCFQVSGKSRQGGGMTKSRSVSGLSLLGSGSGGAGVGNGIAEGGVSSGLATGTCVVCCVSFWTKCRVATHAAACVCVFFYGGPSLPLIMSQTCHVADSHYFFYFYLSEVRDYVTSQQMV